MSTDAAPTPVVTTPTPVPPSRPGAWAWLASRWRPFAGSIKGLVSFDELVNAIHNSFGAGLSIWAVMHFLAIILPALAPKAGLLLAAYVGPAGAAFAVGFIALVGQTLGRAADNTDAAGAKVPAGIVPRPDLAPPPPALARPSGPDDRPA